MELFSIRIQRTFQLVSTNLYRIRNWIVENRYPKNLIRYIPEISSFLDENGNDTMEQQIQANYRQIKQDIVELVENELIRIENDPELKHLLGENGN